MILFNDEPIPFKEFPNGEIMIPKPFFGATKISDFSSSKQNRVTLMYEGDEDLFRLLLVRKSLWFGCMLEIPYFPYSRMDRNSEDWIFTLKTMCKFINLMDWEQVVIFEPHSDVTPALLNHCKIVNMMPRLLKLAGFNYDTDYVMYPDASAHKRYTPQIPTDKVLISLKKRDYKTGRLEFLGIAGMSEETGGVFGVPNLSEQTVWIVDDLCSKGGTFVPVAQALKGYDAKYVNLVVAHCEGAVYQGKVLRIGSGIDGVYTTDSIIRPTVLGDDSKMHVYSYR